MNLRHLVVVLPGIGGTLLAVPDRTGRPTGDVVWGARLQDVDLLRRPERLSLAEHARLVPVGLVPTRKAFGLWTVVPGYDRLLRRLGLLQDAILDDGTSPEPRLDASVVALGYDFRLGVADAAERMDAALQPRLAHLWPDPRDRDGRVVFVAHSMGGLVARRWVSLPGRARLCRAVVTLGTPHRGAPKALDILVNGPAAGPFRVRRPLATIREWPGLADLLPRYPAVEDRTARAGEEPGTEPVRLRPHELPLPWLAGPAGAAHAMHRAIEEGWAELPTPPAMFPRIGFGHATQRACAWDGARVTVTKDPPGGPRIGGWEDDLGDGTVPMFCGLPVEMDNYPRESLGVHRRHGPIAELDQVEALLEALAADAALGAYRAADEGAVGLGLDLDELHPAGRPVPVAAAPVRIGHAVDAPDVAVWATATPLTASRAAGPPVDVRLKWDAGRRAFCGLLPGFAPGLVQVSVTARALTDEPAVQVVEVLDDGDLE